MNTENVNDFSVTSNCQKEACMKSYLCYDGCLTIILNCVIFLHPVGSKDRAGEVNERLVKL